MVPFFAAGLSGWADFNLGRNSFTHRAYRYSEDHPAFSDKDMDPNRFKALNEIYGPDAFE